MRIHYSSSLPDRELSARMNGYDDGSMFGVIDLDGSDLCLDTPEDARRLLEAAARIVGWYEFDGRPHEYLRLAASTHCAVCGLLKSRHAEPVPVITDSEPAPVEFTTSSLPGRVSARCLHPYEHSDNLTGAVVDCDVTEHHAITDSERTCPHSNNGEHCTRGGDHSVHRDSNGDEWRTDTSSFVGRIVEDAHDDSPVPVTGKVVRQIDGETVEVQWDGTSSAMREPIDALRPARKQAASVTA